MAVRVLFLPVDAEVLHEWEILNGKENGRLPAEVGVLVPKVGRHDEEIASAPLIDLPGNNASALPFEDVVDGGTGLSVRKRPTSPLSRSTSRSSASTFWSVV